MGAFNTLANKQFKKDASGNEIYFPWGILGKGYVMPSRAHAEKLQGQTKALLVLVAICLAIPHMMKLHGESKGWFMFASFVVVAVSQTYLWLKVRKYPASKEKMDLDSGYTSKFTRISICLFIQVMSVIGAVVVYYILLESRLPVDMAMAALIVPISLLAFILATRVLLKTVLSRAK